MTAEELKEKLYLRHPGGAYPMPGPWTCVQEFRGIDFLAFSAWSSAGGYRRVGYEVKVSRQDLRRELLAPYKRVLNVSWCHEFYLAVPADLLTKEELQFKEPEWEPKDFIGERCPGLFGQLCTTTRSRQKTHKVWVPFPVTGYRADWDYKRPIVCPTCNGKGVVTKSRVESEAPTCWVPRDLGLVVVNGRGTRLVKRAPLRHEVPVLSDAELGALVRWVSIRPDPRHASRNGRVTTDQRGILPAPTEGG